MDKTPEIISKTFINVNYLNYLKTKPKAIGLRRTLKVTARPRFGALGCMFGVPKPPAPPRTNPAQWEVKGSWLPYNLKPTTFCRCSPKPSMPSVITSPFFRNWGVGFMPRPTPGGVPVQITSPGNRVMNWLT